jgi:hypothetical protein
MITQREISQLAFRLKINDKTIEKDYVITWLLLSLADSSLKDAIVFKGGTALKKIYFPDYRYSEDLDFTVIKEINPEVLIDLLQKTVDKLAQEQAFQFAIPESQTEFRKDSVTVYVDFVGPLQAKLDSRHIKVDFTMVEKIIFPIRSLPIHSAYSDKINRNIATYSLEEILTEKLCAIIGRTEPRDIYDAHFLFGLKEIDFFKIAGAFKEKAKFKGINPTRLTGVLERKKAVLSRTWITRLQNQVRGLPHFEEVLRELKRNIRDHLVL